MPKKSFIVYDPSTGKVENLIRSSKMSSYGLFLEMYCKDRNHRFIHDVYVRNPEAILDRGIVHRTFKNDIVGKIEISYDDQKEIILSRDSLKDLPIVIDGYLCARTGYSVLMRELTKELKQTDLNVRFVEDDNDVPYGIRKEELNNLIEDAITYDELRMAEDIALLSFHHPFLQAYRKKINIIYTMIESYSLNERTIQMMDSCYDKFIVPTKFVKNVLTKYVDEERVEIVPLGVDVSLNHPGIEKEQEIEFKRFDFDHFLLEPAREKPKGLKFLYCGRFSHRKGTDLALQAFAEEFSSKDDVSLVLFALPEFDEGLGHLYKNLRAILSKWRNKSLAPIFICEESYSDKNRSLPYSWGDVFLFPSRGEGFGMTPLEAGACGLPLICSDNSGLSDFISDKTSFVIETDKIDSIGHKEKGVYCGNYPEWNHDAFHDHMHHAEFPIMNSIEVIRDIGKKMRYVYETYGSLEMQEKQKNMIDLIHKEFLWKDCRIKMYDTLKRILK